MSATALSAGRSARPSPAGMGCRIRAGNRSGRCPKKIRIVRGQVLSVRPDPTVQSHDAEQVSAIICEPNFYLVPFASQMIIWAMRKRLHAIYGGKEDCGHVVQVFHMASWGEIYASLLSATQILVTAARSNPLPLHAVACPHLENYEAHWLNALTHLQRKQTEEAVLSLCEVMMPSGARLALPLLESIAQKLLQQSLCFRFVRIRQEAPKPVPQPAVAGAASGNLH